MRYIVKVNPKYAGIREWVEKVVREGMPADGEVIYRGRNVLYRSIVNGTSVVVKEFKKPNPVNAYVYTTLRTSKAERSYRNAMRMSESGFLTPEPVAYGEVRNGLKLMSSCYICRELEGAKEMRNWQDYPNASTLVPAFAHEIYRLHQAGVWHKDFSPGNILYKETAAGTYDFYYVDLNRMKFGVHDRKRQMSMFRSINLNPAETRKLAGYYSEVAGLEKAATEKEALEQLAGYFAERGRKARLKKLLHLNKK